jgi:putative endonuclease
MRIKSKWDVYIIQTKSGKLYTGITTDLDRRFADHLNKGRGARFFHFSSPEKIVFRETYPNRSEATKREIYIKKMNRGEKLNLIKEK